MFKFERLCLGHLNAYVAKTFSVFDKAIAVEVENYYESPFHVIEDQVAAQKLLASRCEEHDRTEHCIVSVGSSRLNVHDNLGNEINTNGVKVKRVQGEQRRGEPFHENSAVSLIVIMT